MLKNISRLKVEIEGKEHLYMCDQDTTLAHVKEALVKFLNYIGKIEESAAQQETKVEEKKEPECKEQTPCPSPE